MRERKQYLKWESIKDQVDTRFLNSVHTQYGKLIERIKKLDASMANPPVWYHKAYGDTVNRDIGKGMYKYDYR